MQKYDPQLPRWYYFLHALGHSVPLRPVFWLRDVAFLRRCHPNRSRLIRTLAFKMTRFPTDPTHRFPLLPVRTLLPFSIAVTPLSVNPHVADIHGRVTSIVASLMLPRLRRRWPVDPRIHRRGSFGNLNRLG